MNRLVLQQQTALLPTAHQVPAVERAPRVKEFKSADSARKPAQKADGSAGRWVGQGADALGVYQWTKFAQAQGPLKLTVDKLEESANPKGATVSANVQFEGKAPIKVRYVLTLREGKIVNEVWQIDPKLVFAATAY